MSLFKIILVSSALCATIGSALPAFGNSFGITQATTSGFNRNFGLQQVSSHSKTVENGHSSVTRHDSRVHNPKTIIRTTRPVLRVAAPATTFVHAAHTAVAPSQQFIQTTAATGDIFQSADGRFFTLGGANQFQAGNVFQTSDGRIFRVADPEPSAAPAEVSVEEPAQEEEEEVVEEENIFDVADAARNSDRPLADTKEVREEHVTDDDANAEVIERSSANNANNNNANTRSQQQQNSVVVSAPLTAANARFVTAAGSPQTIITQPATTSQLFTTADGRTFQISQPATSATQHVVAHTASPTRTVVSHHAAAPAQQFVTVNGARFAASAFPDHHVVSHTTTATANTVPVFTQSTPLFSNQVRTVAAANPGYSLAGTGSVSRGFLVVGQGDVSYQF